MATREEERRRVGLASALGGGQPQQQSMRRPVTPGSLGQGIGQGARAIGQAGRAAGRAVEYPFRQSLQAYGNLAGGFMAGLRGQTPGTDSAVGAQPGPTIPRVQQNPALRQPPQGRTVPDYNMATGRDANPPSLGQRALANRLGGAEITQGPAGSQRQVQDGRTRYAGLGGTAEFQGTPREQGMSVFGGARTDAAAQRSLADYRAQGLDQFGNDMQAIGQLNQTADRMRAANQEQLSSLRASREASSREGELIGLRGAVQRASFSDVADDQQRGEMAERRLASLGAISPQQDLYGTQQGLALQRQGLQQQGVQAQQQAQAAAQQQAIDNRINFERLGLDQAEFNRQVEQDGKLDRVEWGAKIAETYDPFNAPKDADGNPVDRQTYVQQTLNDILAGTGVVAGPDGTIYSASEIQALADRDFGGDVEATKNDMRKKGFLGI